MAVLLAADHSGLEAIDALAERYLRAGKTLHLKHLSPECRTLLDKAGDLVEDAPTFRLSELVVDGLELAALPEEVRDWMQLRFGQAATGHPTPDDVLCILNGESVPRDEVPGTPLSEGDELWIHQAISGG